MSSKILLMIAGLNRGRALYEEIRYLLSARFQLGNLSGPAWLGSARNLHSSARHELENSGSGSSLSVHKITFEYYLPSSSCSANEVLEKNCKILKYDVVRVRIQLSKACSECRLRGILKLRRKTR